MSPAARPAKVVLPEFGVPESEPDLPPEIYEARLDRLRALMDARGLEHIVLYADREHSANVSWLTGFDPRFEEALVIVGGDGQPAILVGNECWGTAGAAPLHMRRYKFQEFSLPNQPRDRYMALLDILGEEGIGHGSTVGMVGWKTYSAPWMSDLPAYIVDSLRHLAGPDYVQNATGLLTNAQDGQRVINEPEQIAYLEWAACHTSEGVKRLLREVRPGMPEREAVALLGWNGPPLPCHVMLTAGPRARTVATERMF